MTRTNRNPEGSAMPSSLIVFLAGGDETKLDRLRLEAQEAKNRRRARLEKYGLKIAHSANVGRRK